MYEFSATGGARMGRANASWPFAKLSVNRHRLELNVGIMGKAVFLPSDVITLEPVSGYFGKGGAKSGFRIRHKVEGYNKEILFLVNSRPEELLRQIKATGFLDNKEKPGLQQKREITALQQSGTFPLKKSVGIAIIVLWNLFFIAGIVCGAVLGEPALKTMFLTAAIGGVWLICMLTLFVPSFASLLLKEGRTGKDIQLTLIFLVVILSIIGTAFSLVDFPV